MGRPKTRPTRRAADGRSDDGARDAPLVGALLRFAHQVVIERLLAALADAGYSDLGEAHLKVLRYPPPDGVRPGVFAQRAQMTKQAMNYLLVQLEELGYLRRHDGDAGGRLVSLTDRGWEVAALQRRTVRATERAWAARVGEERFATFLGVLEEIALTRPTPSNAAGRAPRSP